VSKRASLLIAFAFVTMVFPPRARTASIAFNLTIKGALLNSFSPTTCGDELGDTYDTFCPSGACACFQYDDPDKSKFSGNKVGQGKAGTVHFTRDGGGDGTGDSGHSGSGCNPVFGEVQVPGSKDHETIYFNGSICEPQSNPSAKKAAQKMAGGWSIHSSAHGIKAFGTFTGKFLFNAIGFHMTFTGETH
jgi:hypothetical protein